MSLRAAAVIKRAGLLQRLTGVSVAEFAHGRPLEESIAEFPERAEIGILVDGTERPVHAVIRTPHNRKRTKNGAPTLAWSSTLCLIGEEV